MKALHPSSDNFSSLPNAFEKILHAAGKGSVLAAAVTVIAIGPAFAQPRQWIHQFGSVNPEQAVDVAADGAGVFVAGQIDRGNLPGQTSTGSIDGFVGRFDADGTAIWMRQFGTLGVDRIYGAAADESGVYVVGGTTGVLPGQTSAGGYDAFVVKYDRSGQLLWARQFGSSVDDEAFSAAAGPGAIYVSGWSQGTLPGQTSAGIADAFACKIDATGAIVWMRQFGSAGFDQALAITPGEGGLYVAGRAGLALPGQTHIGSADAFVRKYDLDGNENWTRQFGTLASDIGLGITSYAGGFVVVGRVSGALPGHTHYGSQDAFVRRYDVDGNEIWTRQFGTAGADEANGVGKDASGLYVGGRANMSLPLQTSAGADDAFLRKYDGDGHEMWTDQFGSSTLDLAVAVSVCETGAYTVGHTFGTLPGETSSGGKDAFLVCHEVPRVETPPALALTLDILPGDCPNPFNLQWYGKLAQGKNENEKAGGVLPVALAGSADFDVNDVDPSSVRLQDVEPLRWSYEDVTSPTEEGDCHCPDGPDGIPDLTIKFSRQDLAEAIINHPGGVRSLTLSARLFDGTAIEASDCLVITGLDGVALDPLAPNPFNPVTRIRFALLSRAPVKLAIYDVSGRLVEKLLDDVFDAGEHTVYWDAAGRASGIYMCRLQAGGVVESQRVILLK